MRRRCFSRCAALAAVATLFLPVATSAAARARPFPRFYLRTCARSDFLSSGTRVRAELCHATKDAAAGRAVVVLHGCGGFSTFDHRLAGDLPQMGIATLYIDFFAPTPPPGNRGFCGVRRTTFSHRDIFTRWQHVVLDAAASLRRTPNINPRRVGVVGWSLGGGLAVATAAAAELPGSSRRPFAAVVGFSTGGDLRRQPAVRLPPLLLLSGGTTDAIPLVATEALYRSARAAGDQVELFVYPHGVHDWRGRQGRVGIRRAVAFLTTQMH